MTASSEMPALPPKPPLAFWAPVASLLLSGASVLSGAGSQTVWQLIRASGVLTYLLLSLTVIAGLLISSRSISGRQSRIDSFEVHGFMSLLVLGFGSFHATALLFDNFVGFSPREVLIPFTSGYRPLAVGFGSLTLYLSFIIYASFWARRAIGVPAWRVLHYGSFPAFAFATYHGLFAGSDTSADWMMAIYFGAMALVAGLLMYRVLITLEGKRKDEIEALGPFAIASLTGLPPETQLSHPAAMQGDTPPSSPP